ncbi:MAG: CBS domain-containing protein [Sandaracinaceae bacterium]|jgi:acetoin utilization protein AcuB|nr:CBS domain-containing protein [Sandaracinaceae bacterium]
MTQPHISECMTKAPYTISNTATLLEARKRMQNAEIRHLPVVYGERLVGVISDRDLDVALALDESQQHALVSSLMVEEVYVAEPTEKLAHVLRVMVNRKLGSAVVAEKDNVLGVFTTTDALHMLAKLLEE